MNETKLYRTNGALALLTVLVLALLVVGNPLAWPILGILIAVAWLKTPSHRLCTIAGAGATQTRYVEKPCTVAVKNNFDTHGTITRASVQHLTPQDVFDLFKPGGLFADMNAWFQTAFEMKACGTKVNGLYDWLMSGQRDLSSLLSEQKVQAGPSLLFPFVLARQDSVINNEYWAVTQGQANSAYTAGVTGPLTAGDLALGAATDRVIRVVSRYGIDLDAKYFVPKARLYHFSRQANGAAYQGQWKVLAAEQEAVASPTYCDILVTSENSGNTRPYDQTPTAGVILIGGNNVNDFESYCQNRVTVDPRRVVPFWYQTMRRVRTVDSEYKVYFQRMMESNAYFREFGDLPLSIRNAQDEAMFQKEYLNAFFFGLPISSNQTTANWQSLESITSVTGSLVDPGQGGKLMARRANMIGVKEQLVRCGNYRDLQNRPLNFYEWLQENYRIKRARESRGKTVTGIDWFTSQPMSANMQAAFFAYYQNEYADSVRINVEDGQSEEFGFVWTSWTVKMPAGIKINLVTHNFFDDYRDAFNTENVVSQGNLLLALELGGSIYPGMIKSNRVTRTLGQLNQLATIDRTFACTMDLPTEDITLTSQTSTAVVECPANNSWIENLQDTVPVTTGISGSTTSAYVDLY